MKRIIWAVAIIAIVLFFAFRLYSNKVEINKAAQFKEKIENVPVRITKVAMQAVDYEFSYLGSFAPAHEVNFGAEMQGKIIQTYIEEGNPVTKGQLLAKIDAEKLQIRLSSEQVALENAKATYQKLSRDLERYKNLQEENAIADINFQQSKLSAKQAELNTQSAQIQIKSTQKDISQTNIIAPISGYLTNKIFEVGTMASPNANLGTITDISNVKLVAMIPESDILKFQKGQSIKVSVDALPDKEFEGSITQISVKADAAHNYKIEITVPNSSGLIKAGMYGTIKGKNSQKQNKLLIPRAALVGSVKQPQVFVAESGVAKLRNIVIGNSFGNNLEIVSGLKEGESVIATGQLNLQDGTTIKIDK